jgi:hypothetical protein
LFPGECAARDPKCAEAPCLSQNRIPFKLWAWQCLGQEKERDDSPESQLDGFLDKYTPDIARNCLARMRARLPGATQLVFDNYNALVMGFGPSGKPSDAIFSIVIYPRYVSLSFLQGASVPDPKKLLKGTGSVARHIRLELASDLDKPAIRQVMTAAFEEREAPLIRTPRADSSSNRSLPNSARVGRPEAVSFRVVRDSGARGQPISSTLRPKVMDCRLRVQQDGQRRDVFRSHVTVHQESLSILGHVIGKNVGR